MPPRSSSPQRGGPPVRNLQYSAPEVPSFLQKLHAEVNGGRGGSGAFGGGGGGPSRRRVDKDEDDDGNDGFANLLTGDQDAGARRSKQADSQDGEDEGEADEWEGAQVVVLKEGRHLTEGELKAAQEEQRERNASKGSSGAPASSSSSAHIATSGSGLPSKRKRQEAIPDSSVGDDDSLGRPMKAPGNAAASSSSSSSLAAAKDLIAAEKQRKKQEAKARERQDKAKVMKKEKRKVGKGLSFDQDD